MNGFKNLSLIALVVSLGASCSTTPSYAASYKMDTFYDVDVDKSGFLEDGEYKTYAWGRADWDNDGYLEETEYVKYTEVYYDTYDLEYDTFIAYDTDGDGFINRTEFNDIPTAPLYKAWDYDEDGSVSSKDWDKISVEYIDRD